MKKILLIATNVFMLFSSMVHAVDTENDSTDSVDIQSVVPTTSLPPDAVDQVLYRSVLHSPQDLVNARLVGPRYRHQFKEAKAHWQYQMQLDNVHRAWNAQPQLHLQASMNPLQDLGYLAKLQQIAQHQMSDDPFVILDPGNLFDMSNGGSIIHQAQGQMSIRIGPYEVSFERVGAYMYMKRDQWSADDLQVTPFRWKLPCLLRDSLLEEDTYRFVYASKSIKELADRDLLGGQAEPHSKQDDRVWAMIYRVLPDGTFQGICGGMGYFEPISAPDQ